MQLITVSDNDLLVKVKQFLAITGTAQDNQINILISDVKNYIRAGGISENVLNSTLAVGCICRGVSDLYINDIFSNYFYQRLIQLNYEVGDSNV